MRTRDSKKQINEKAAKTINLDLLVLQKLEARAKDLNMSDSQLANLILRRSLLNDEEFFTEISKFHYLEFQKYQFMKEQVILEKTIKN